MSDRILIGQSVEILVVGEQPQIFATAFVIGTPEKELLLTLADAANVPAGL